MRTTEKYKIAYKHVAGDLRSWSVFFTKKNIMIYDHGNFDIFQTILKSANRQKETISSSQISNAFMWVELSWMEKCKINYQITTKFPFTFGFCI